MEVEEALQIDVKEVPETKQNNIDLDISIDDNGIGEIEFNSTGFLESLIVPSNTLSIAYNMLCVNKSKPQDAVFNIKDTQGGIFQIRRSVHDEKGKMTDFVDKIYLNGEYVVRVSGAIPKSTLSLTLMVS